PPKPYSTPSKRSTQTSTQYRARRTARNGVRRGLGGRDGRLKRDEGRRARGLASLHLFARPLKFEAVADAGSCPSVLPLLRVLYVYAFGERFGRGLFRVAVASGVCGRGRRHRHDLDASADDLGRGRCRFGRGLCRLSRVRRVGRAAPVGYGFVPLRGGSGMPRARLLGREALPVVLGAALPQEHRVEEAKVQPRGERAEDADEEPDARAYERLAQTHDAHQALAYERGAERRQREADDEHGDCADRDGLEEYAVAERPRRPHARDECERREYVRDVLKPLPQLPN